jgi:hypothetical protein
VVPYIGPEFVAAILGRESDAAVDLPTGSESDTETARTTVSSRRAIGDKPVELHFSGKYLGCEACVCLRS